MQTHLQQEIILNRAAFPRRAATTYTEWPVPPPATPSAEEISRMDQDLLIEGLSDNIDNLRSDYQPFREQTRLDIASIWLTLRVLVGLSVFYTLAGFRQEIYYLFKWATGL